MNKPYGWVDEINTFVLDKDYRQLPKSLQNGMTPLYANKVPDGLIDPKSFYEGYENGKKSQRAKLENRLGRTTVIKSLEYKSSPPNTKKGTVEMNAYELADRIAELEKKLQESALDYISVCSQADEHYARVQESEKVIQLNNEVLKPMLIDCIKRNLSVIDANLFFAKYDSVRGTKERITPQTKTLTNDEIREIGDECELKNNGILNWIDFARAIEERHWIK